MQINQFLKKINQYLFSGNIFKLFFSYKGVIARTPYIIAVFLLLMMTRLCILGFISYIIVFFLLIYCLTALVQKRARSFRSSGTGYILTNIALLYTGALTYDIDVSFFPTIKWGIYAVITIAILANLLLVIRPSKQNIDEQKRSFLTRFPILFSIIAVIGIFGMFELKDKYMPDTNRPAFHLGLAVGEIYRHTYAYPEFCMAQGYEMVNYPNKVREKFKKEIEIAENDQMALLKKNFELGNLTENYNNINEFYNGRDWGTKEERFSGVSSFFEALREQLIVIDIAKEQNIEPDEVKLTKEDNKRVSLKEVCKVIDDDAEYFVSVDCPFNYILSYAGTYSNCGTYFNTKEPQ